MKLSAIVVTYNHARYVEQAVRTVLDQETDFEFEVLISEDCSTDDTRAIVQGLAAEHPDRIRLLLSDTNLNSNEVVRRAIDTARGEYLALLDGDDFWTSPHKLQKQVDFLDARPGCSLSFHNVDVVYEDGATPSHRFHEDEPATRLAKPKPKPESELADIVRTDFIPTCSTVIRTAAVRPLPAWYDTVWSGDWPLHIICAERGRLGYLDEVLATYRIHAGALWASNVSLYRSAEDVETIVGVYDAIDEYLRGEYAGEIGEEVANLYELAAVAFYRRGDYKSARACARRSLARRPRLRWLTRWRPPAVLLLSRLRAI